MVHLHVLNTEHVKGHNPPQEVISRGLWRCTYCAQKEENAAESGATVSNVVGGPRFSFPLLAERVHHNCQRKVSLLDPSHSVSHQGGVLDTMRDLSNKVEIEVSIMVDLDMFNSP